MASVDSKTSIKIDELINNTVHGGYINSSAHLILTTIGGGEIDAGLVGGSGTAAGLIQVWPGAADVIPDGWLLCDGSSHPRADYPELFNKIGTAYGSADVYHFNLPDLRGRTVVGYDSGQTEFNALGKTGGAKTHTLTTPEIPAHTHANLPVTFANTLGNTTTSPVSSVAQGAATSRFSALIAQSVTDTAGGGGAHNNLQPYNTLNYIISTVTQAWVDFAGSTICTSTTRPADPTAGDMIYETDTGKSYVYDGTEWQLSGGGGGGSSSIVELPALTAGVWATVAHDIATPITQLTVSYMLTASGEAIQLDTRNDITYPHTTFGVRSDLAWAAGDITALVQGA